MAQFLTGPFFAFVAGRTPSPACKMLKLSSPTLPWHRIHEQVVCHKQLCSACKTHIHTQTHTHKTLTHNLNRFDEQVVFHKLSRAHVRTIAQLMLRETQERVQELGKGYVLRVGALGVWFILWVPGCCIGRRQHEQGHHSRR